MFIVLVLRSVANIHSTSLHHIHTRINKIEGEEHNFSRAWRDACVAEIEAMSVHPSETTVGRQKGVMAVCSDGDRMGVEAASMRGWRSSVIMGRFVRGDIGDAGVVPTLTTIGTRGRWRAKVDDDGYDVGPESTSQRRGESRATDEVALRVGTCAGKVANERVRGGRQQLTSKPHTSATLKEMRARKCNW